MAEDQRREFPGYVRTPAGQEAAARERAIVEARSRLDELNAITRQYGRPYTPARPLDEMVKELPAQWYRSWH